MSSLLIYLALFGSATFAGVLMFKLTTQKQRDNDRQTYTLSFPKDLDPERVEAWLRSISGTLRGGKFALNGQPNIVFEVVATDQGIRHRLKVPWTHKDYVVSQLRSLSPGVNVQPLDEYDTYEWTQAVEVGLSNPARTLRISAASDVSTSVLASLQALKEGEAVIVQWVVTPAVPEKLPDKRSTSSEFSWSRLLLGDGTSQDEVNERRNKLQEPNMLAVLRVGAMASTDKRATHLIYKVRAAITAVRTPHNAWQKKTLPASTVKARIDRATSPLVFSAQLSVSELTALIAWPLGSPHVAGLPRGGGAVLPTPASVARVGRIIGDSNFFGDERPIAVTAVDSCKHWHFVGRTGSGKTALMANMAAQDMQAGRGVILIDPKYDLFKAALDYVPAHRMQDVVVFDVSDGTHPVGFNILGQGSPEIVASEVQAIFNHIYDTQGVRMPEALYHALITLMTTTAGKGFTFVDIIPLLWPNSRQDHIFSKAVIQGVRDPYIRNWWTNIESMSRSERDKYFQALRSRVWQLNSRAEVRHIIGQSASSFDIREVLKKRQILLVNLSGVPDEAKSLIGSLIINSAVHGFKDGLASQQNPVSVYLDEFHHFVHSPINPETMLAELRSFGAALHLAHQGLDQLAGRKQLLSAVMNNAVNKVVFQRGADDARAFAAEFGQPVKDDHLKELGLYEFMARVVGDEGISPPITGRTRPPMMAEGYGQRVRLMSRSVYGRPATEVEREIQARRQVGSPGTNKRPNLGDESL